MTESDFNLTNPVDSLHNVAGLTPAQQRRKRKKPPESQQKKRREDENGDSPADGQPEVKKNEHDDFDDSIGIDYCA